jgi:hypothetical protein
LPPADVLARLTPFEGPFDPDQGGRSVRVRATPFTAPLLRLLLPKPWGALPRSEELPCASQVRLPVEGRLLVAGLFVD